MKEKTSSRMVRFAGCAGLLALLAASSYAGRQQTLTPAVPVMFEMVSAEAAAAYTVEQTQERLNRQREEALALLQSILDDPSADEASKDKAIQEKTRIASRMETEASVTALLAHMGFEQAAVVMGDQMLSLIVPWQAAENEQNRIRLIDAAVSQSGFSADAVKIILAKK